MTMPDKSKSNIFPFPSAGTDNNLTGGGGGPHDPTMEMRLLRLEDTFPRIEALMKSVDDRLRKVEIDLGEMKGRVTRLPSTWAMVTTLLGGQIAFVAAIFAILRFGGTH